jgi:hypothetical protein
MELIGEKEEAQDETNVKDMQTLADLINNPSPNRNIAEFEGADDD